jgi:hypothetical protein
MFTKVDVSKLVKAPINWIVDDTGVLMATGQSVSIMHSIKTVCEEAIKGIESLIDKTAIHVMVNRVSLNIHVPIHTDTVLQSLFTS